MALYHKDILELARHFRKANQPAPGGFQADARVRAEQKKRQDAEARAFHHAILRASEQRVAEFQHRMDRLDEKITAALIENEEKLREARKELEEYRKTGKLVTLPDGRKEMAYRDGDDIRNEAGEKLHLEIPAKEISRDANQWTGLRSRAQGVSGLEAQGARWRELLERADTNRQNAPDMSAAQLDTAEAALFADVEKEIKNAEKVSDPDTELAVRQSQLDRMSKLNVPGPGPV